VVLVLTILESSVPAFEHWEVPLIYSLFLIDRLYCLELVEVLLSVRQDWHLVDNDKNVCRQ
jgi:hypothetical protein